MLKDTKRNNYILLIFQFQIVVSLLNDRPSANDFFNSTVLQEWTRATNVRLRFLRTKTLLGHLMSVARQDPTVTRRVSYVMCVSTQLYVVLMATLHSEDLKMISPFGSVFWSFPPKRCLYNILH
jgi:hypothetical protein